MEKRWQVFLLLLVAGVIGIIVIVSSHWIPNDTASAVLLHIGIGLLVAGIVGLTVEWYVREQMRLQMDRMLKDIGTDVFKAALGHEFPESIWHQISTHLLMNPIIRRDLSLDYSLEEMPESGKDFLMVKTCWSYTLTNLNTEEERLYKLAAALDCCLDSSFRGYTRFTRVEIDGKAVNEDDLTVEYREAEVVCRTIVTLQPSGSKHVTLYGESVYRKEQIIPFSMTDATENLTVCVSKPPNIVVVVDALHPREQRLIKQPTSSPDSHVSWILLGGLLPGHGVCIRWFPC